MSDQLNIKNLSKNWGSKQVLIDISFTVSTGTLAVITGSNGSGKTTLLQLIAGLSLKKEGQVLWNGACYGLELGKIGYLAHKPMLYENLSVLENIVFFSKMYGCFSLEHVASMLRRVGLWLYRYEPAAILSRGMQQRLAIARTLISDPKLILYDEPFTGLDVEGRQLLCDILQENLPKTIQLVITHKLDQLAGLDYRELKLVKGHLVEEGACCG